MIRSLFTFILSIFLALAFLTACSQTVPDQAIPNTPISSNCAVGYTHLAPGTYARLSPAGPPNRLRKGPSTFMDVIGQILPGTILKVNEGPVCADGLVFWKVAGVDDPTIIGWTAEGNGKAYWLEPYQP